MCRLWAAYLEEFDPYSLPQVCLKFAMKAGQAHKSQHSWPKHHKSWVFHPGIIFTVSSSHTVSAEEIPAYHEHAGIYRSAGKSAFEVLIIEMIIVTAERQFTLL